MTQARWKWLGIACIVLIVLFKSTLISDLISIFVFGVLPGTNVTIPAWIMLITYPLLLVGFLYWLGVQSLFIGEKTPPVKAKKTVKKTARKSPARRKTTSTVAKRRTRTAT